MTEDELTAIEQRLQLYGRYANERVRQLVNMDLPALLAEHRRLRETLVGIVRAMQEDAEGCLEAAYEGTDNTATAATIAYYADKVRAALTPAASEGTPPQGEEEP